MDYKNVFDRIFYVSPTVMLDKSTEWIREDDDIVKIADNLDELDNIISSIMEIQKEKPEDEREEILVILDDMLGFFRSRGGAFNYLLTRYRHYRMSFILTSQKYREVPSLVRSVADYWVLFANYNRKELDAMKEEFSTSIPKFVELYKDATNKRYSFMYINKDDMRVYKRFDELMWEKS